MSPRSTGAHHAAPECADSWLDRRTFRGADYSAEQLAALKSSHTISVVLPARNESATVAGVVTELRRELVERVALVDEIVVIDSHSTDPTADVARRAGARVHPQAAILPDVGDVPGKGEALWKSLAVTSGDIIVFLDADLREFDASFATGLLGPLLTDPGIEFVKGCYERPLQNGQTIHPSGGGRVTELVARPLLAAHWPALSGFAQPLAGEYAGTRRAFESIPFASGYGLEVGMLVDLYETFGLDSLAQADLGRRLHRNSPDATLSLMSLQLHHAMFDRLRRYGHITAEREPGVELTLHHRDPVAGGFRQERHEVVTGERPPMSSVLRTSVR